MEKNIRNTFYQAHSEEIRMFLEKIRAELLEDVVPFWEKRIVDTENGGYFNGFDRQGNKTDRDKYGWFVGRDMYLFAALCNEIEWREPWFEIARHGRSYMDTVFCAKDGRFPHKLSEEGAVIEGETSVFTDHFAVKGLYEYICAMPESRKWQEYGDGQAGTRETEIRWVKELTEKLLVHVKDEAVLRQEGVRQGMKKHAVNFMTLIVLLEGRRLFGTAYDKEIEACVHSSLYEFADDERRATFENIGLDGRSVLKGEGCLMDPGHTLESLWFAMKAGREMNRPEYLTRAAQVMDWVIDRCYDEEYGGFFQYVDVFKQTPDDEFLFNDYCGTPVRWDDKIWWVQAEALYALAMSALLNENERHYEYFKKQFAYVEEHFRDKAYGEWYALLKRDGSMLLDAKGFALKGPYHVPRCLMNLTVLMEQYLKC